MKMLLGAIAVIALVLGWSCGGSSTASKASPSAATVVVAQATTVAKGCPKGCTAQSPGCVIKGNISSGGKIYHVPGGGSYTATKIDPSAGERWFCTDAEAVANGWRKAKN
jgi:hypothetical protein